MDKVVKRRIEAHRVHMNPGAHKHRSVGGSICITFAECGHTAYRKLSQGLPKTMSARCDECSSLASGVRVKTGQPDGSWLAWTWDAETNLPVSRVVPAP